MKVVCPACEGMARVQSFRVEGAALFLTCARCGVESRAEVVEPPSAPVEPPRVVPMRPVAVGDAVRLAAEAAQRPDPFEVPDDRCPKCVGPRPEEALFCPHCGLAWANFRPEHVAFSEELGRAFLEAMRQWDDASKHEAVLALATRTGELPALGRLYRLRLAAAPLDPIAQRGREEVLRRASAGSEVLRTLPGSPASSRLTRIAAMVLGFLLLGVVGGLVYRLVAG